MGILPPSFGQNTFSKIFYPDELGAERIDAMVEVEDGYILLVNTGAAPDYINNILLVRTTKGGEVLWRKRYTNGEYSILPSSGYANHGLYRHSPDSLYVSGDIYRPDTDLDGFLMLANAEGDSIWRRTYGGVYYDPYGTVAPLNDSTLLLFADRGTGPFNQDDVWVAAADLGGDLIWETFLAEGYGSVARQDIRVLGNGNIAVLYYDCDTAGACNSSAYKRLRMAMLNSNGEELWTTTVLEVDDLGIGAPLTGNMLELDNGRLLVAFYWEEGLVSDHPCLYWVDENGEVVKQHRFFEEGNWLPQYIKYLFLTGGGDVIGVGYGHYYDEDWNFYSACAWIFSMTQDGQLNWETMVYEDRGPLKNGRINTGLETENNELLFTGYIVDDDYNHGISWLLQLDSLGCYEPGCGYFQLLSELGTGVATTPPLRADYALSPNPVAGHQPLRLAHRGGPVARRMVVLDGLGRLVAQQRLSGLLEQQLPPLGLPPGWYTIRLEDRRGLPVWTGKLAVVE